MTISRVARCADVLLYELAKRTGRICTVRVLWLAMHERPGGGWPGDVILSALRRLEQRGWAEQWTPMKWRQPAAKRPWRLTAVGELELEDRELAAFSRATAREVFARLDAAAEVW
jgi:hypothetical protein